MATYTDNYHLSKPETTDSQQSFIEDYATNMEIIDENMGGGSGGGGHTIVNPAGTDMAQEPKMQFAGKVSVADDSTNQKTIVDVLPQTKEVTQAEYDALPESKLTDGVAYFIKDGGGYVDGDKVSWTQIQNSGTKIAEININGTSQDVFAPKSGEWEKIATNAKTASWTQDNETIVYFMIYWNAFQLWTIFVGKNGGIKSNRLIANGDIGGDPSFSISNGTVTATWNAFNDVKILK